MFDGVVSFNVNREMGVKAKKKAITKKLKKAASDFSASRDEAREFLVRYLFVQFQYIMKTEMK